MFDAGVPAGWGYYWKSHYLPPLTDAAIDAMVELGWQRSSPASFSFLFHLGGAIGEGSEDDSAASGRDAAHALNINAAWSDGGPQPSGHRLVPRVRGRDGAARHRRRLCQLPAQRRG